MRQLACWSIIVPLLLTGSSAAQDKPIQFPRTLEQIPGFIGVGLPAVMTPPQDSVRLNEVLSLADLRPASDRIKLERNPAIRLTTPLSGGAFAASIQLRHREFAMQIGLLLLVALMTFVIVNDISHIMH